MADNVPEPVFRAFLALDWADKKHAFALEDAVTCQRQSGFLDHTPEAVQAWACELTARFSAAPIAVCLEQSRGPLLSMLLEFENFLVYPVPPQAVAKLRAAFYSSGSKDDPQDAELVLEILQHHRRHLRPLRPDTVEIRQLRLLVADRRDLVDEKTRHKNRLTDRLKQYYPRVLNWFDNLDTPVALDFLERWPTLDQAQQARPSALRKFFERHGCHNLQRNERRIASIRQAVPLTSDAAVCEPGRARVLTEVALLRQLLRGIAVLEDQIAQLTQAHQDYALFEGLPGAGAALAPRLLAAFGSRRERFQSAEEVQKTSGIAPVRERSGNKDWVHVRRACSKFLRQTFHEFAAFSVRQSVWAGAYYEQKRAQGQDHHAAVRALAFKWIRILYRCWQDGTLYDESRFLEALERRGSPLAQCLPAVERL